MFLLGVLGVDTIGLDVFDEEEVGSPALSSENCCVKREILGVSTERGSAVSWRLGVSDISVREGIGVKCQCVVPDFSRRAFPTRSVLRTWS